jgi:hypothetical protein
MTRGTSQPLTLNIAEGPSGDMSKSTFSTPGIRGNGMSDDRDPNPENANDESQHNLGLGRVQGDAEPLPAENARPEEQERETALNTVTLSSRLSRVPNFSPWLLAACSIAVTSFTVYYGWNASFSSTPSAHFLWNRPDNTIFTVNLLSYLATILVGTLVTATCDQLRWTKCCAKEGMPFLKFLALSSATPVSGLLHLLLSPLPPVFSLLRSMGPRLWSLQRYNPLLFIF